MWPSGPPRALGRLALQVLAVLFAGGCGSQSGAGPAATVVDSAGVTIVTNPEGSLESAAIWTLSPSPMVDIGSGANPEVPLYRVRAVAPLEGRRVAVATEAPPQVRVFDAIGALLFTAGRRGDGPGEFAAVASVVALRDDSLAAWDDNRRRISVFNGSGDFAREVDLSGLVPRSPDAAGNVSEPAAWTTLLPAGPDALVLFEVGMFGPGMGVRRVEVPSHRIDPSGDVLSTFGPFPGEETIMDDRFGLAPFRFAATTYGATRGDRLVVGTAEASEVEVFGPDGSLDRIIRWPDRDRAVRGPLVDAWNEWLDEILEAQSPDEERSVREFLDQMPLPELFPAYAGLVVSDEGEVWVGDYPGQLGMLGLSSDRPRVPERTWLVFDVEGTLRSTLSTPIGFQPHAVRDGLVWGVFTDELDVESVRAYELERP